MTPTQSCNRWLPRSFWLLSLVPLWLLIAALAADEPLARPAAVARLAAAAEVRRTLGVSPEYDQVNVARIKIAVLDFGFDGLDGKRPYLPASTVLVEHYDADFVTRNDLGDPRFQRPFVAGNHHGRHMAQIVWAVTGMQADGPQFYLLNANGPTLFRRAVRYAIEQQVDVILFAGVFEGGGNGDGKGFINRVVGEAVAAGIIWINAAGNFGGRTWEGPVTLAADGMVRFEGAANPTMLRFRNRLDENTVTVTLTWSDYRDSEDAGTEKDLDLFVYNSFGRQVGSGTLRQIAGRLTGEGESRNPRERVVLSDLPSGEYWIRVKAQTPTLFGTTDRLRVLVSAERNEAVDALTGAPLLAVPFHDANRRGELYPPADHPLVITVGDLGPNSSAGATADHRRKPDVALSDSRATFTDGLTTTGASNAAAYFAGIAVLLKAADERLATRHLLALGHPSVNPSPGSARTGSTNPPTPVTTRLTRTGGVVITPNSPSAGTSTARLSGWRTPTRQELADRLTGEPVPTRVPAKPVPPPPEPGPTRELPP
ncbi:MAG TPA: S8 family serine peptidase [Gemmatales bacterium]|nr:S8 family serine peptidase [Gemmatales bacterium]